MTDIAMSDLLPCPFCGSATLQFIRHFAAWPPGVMCMDCYSSATRVERWNTRTLPADRIESLAAERDAQHEARKQAMLEFVKKPGV